MKKAEVQTQVQVAEDDVDDVVEIALQMMDEDEGQLSLDELKEIGDELEIPAEYIARAQKELETNRAHAKAQEHAEAERKTTLKRNVTVGAAVVGGVLVLWSAVSVSSLGDLHASVEAQAAQVANVTERKTTVMKLYQGRANSADRDAEVVGAENRIRVESKRYSDLAAKYNASASGFPVSIVRGIAGLPAKVPMQPE